MLTLVASSSVPSWLKEWFRFPALGSETKPSTAASTFSYQPPGRALPSSIDSSLRTFYTANSSPSYSSSRQPVNSTSTASSNNSYHYSVTSINSRKSRKNVFYPSRAHLPPITVSLDSVVAIDIPIWDVEYLCAVLLPDTETRLMPAGRVLLRALGIKADSPRRASKWTDEEFRYCSQLFIVLAREIVLKDAARSEELEGPCNHLHETFRDILFKFKPLSVLTTSSSTVTGLQVSRVESPEFKRFIYVLRALRAVTDTFKEALNMVKPPAASDEALQDHQRRVLWRLSASTSPSLTMDQYCKELGQKLMQTQEQSNYFARQPEATYRSNEIKPMVRPYHAAPRSIPTTIEESPEAEDEGNSVSGHTRSRSRSGTHLPRRFWNRLLSPFAKRDM
ncbi:hypothetical protein BJY52DRAFT_1257395 [Lactarius psammicola]|nr:hypothetical protein BJY52DRAFT_1257395 [Lactarius psammicola]